MQKIEARCQGILLYILDTCGDTRTMEISIGLNFTKLLSCYYRNKYYKTFPLIVM